MTAKANTNTLKATLKATVDSRDLARVLRLADLTSTGLYMVRELVCLSISEEEPGWMRVTTTGIEMTTHAWCRVRGDEPGEVVVNRRTLKDWVGLMEGPISLCCERENLRADSGRSQAWFRIVESSLEFPSPQQIGDEFQVGDLESIRKAAIAVARGMDRPILTGVLFKPDGNGGSVIVGTDGYRLSECRIAGTVPEVVVPHAERVGSMIDLVPGKATMSIRENRAIFRAETEDLRVQMEIIALAGHYPEYQALLPQEFPLRAVVPVPELLRACKMSTVAQDDREEGTIILHVLREEGEIKISPSDANGASYVKAVSVEGEEEEVRVAVSGPWLIQGLRLVRDPEVTLGFVDYRKPILVASSNWRYFIMPRFLE